MAFLKSDLITVAKLARLSLKVEEIPRLIEDLDRIIAFVAELEEVDVTDVKPMSHAKEFVSAFREDNFKDVLGRDCFTGSAGYEDGLIRVPKIID